LPQEWLAQAGEGDFSVNHGAAISALGLVAALLMPQAAYAQAGCTAHDAQAAAINPTLEQAVSLIEAKKITDGIALLPRLEALLAQVPAAMPAPERCGSDVVIFDDHQFAEIEALSAAGRAVPGYPADADFTYKDIPYADLAFITGWLTYEAGDFSKALTFYQKGLAIAPNDHSLTSEVLSTLVQLQDGAELIAFTDRFLASDSDADAKLRSNVMLSKAIGQALEGDKAAALTSVDAALQLSPENEAAADLKAQLSGES
jgi:tetratricopeptide (TPR) repeat protein